MHPSVMTFVREQVAHYNLAFTKKVLEVGSLDVNGSVRPLFGPKSDYIGVDVCRGPGVDLVLEQATHLPFEDGRFEVVVSTEMLEHCARPVPMIAEMARVLKAGGGRILLTTRSQGFPYHHPPDHWRFSCEQVRDLLQWTGLEVVEVFQDPEAPGVFASAMKLK